MNALGEGLARARFVVRWIVLAGVIGALSGLLSAAFLESLRWATTSRVDNAWLVWLLPVVGLVVGLTYHHLGSGLERGSNLIIEQIHSHTEAIPLRLTPIIFGASIVSHLAGASVGREGAALQLSAGVADPISRRLGLGAHDRSIMLIAAVAGGFGSVFGVPVAGAVFALEIQRVGRVRYEALVPAFTASIVGDAMVHVAGVEHTKYPALQGATWNPSVAWRVALFGLLAGIIGTAFVTVTHLVRNGAHRVVTWSPARPMAGGVLLAIVIVACGWRDYQGLSIPLALEAMNGSAAGQWITKLVLSAFSIGVGFVGGEVIPLFVVGALAGASFASLTGANVALFATLGSVAVLAGAANAPLSCTLLGLELFGGTGIALFGVVCAAAYVSSGHKGIYHAQPVSAHKGPRSRS